MRSARSPVIGARKNDSTVRVEKMAVIEAWVAPKVAPIGLRNTPKL